MTKPLLAALAGLTLLCSPSAAQDTAALELELNALQAAEAGCRITFLATNRLGGQLDRAAVELALFDTAGAIDRIVTLDLRTSVPARPRCCSSNWRTCNATG
jgi:hypothetical protein